MKTAFTFFLLLNLSNVFAQGGAGREWSLVYESDENGKKLQGDRARLISILRKGQPIRIGWTIENPSNKAMKVEHVTDAAFATIMNDTIIYAQITPIVGQTPDFIKQSITFKENMQWAFMASSAGNHDAMFTNIKTGEILSHKGFKCAIRWYANVH